jgi:molybdenum cofactor biosynthesis enzyme MoaA
MYAVKKLNDDDLVKIIEWFRSVIININFISYPLLHLFIDVYYDKSKPLHYFYYLL